jgi:hypothetical protein
MLKVGIPLIGAALVAAPAAAENVRLDFSTFEPFAGGIVAFGYNSEAPIVFDRFIEASALDYTTPGLARIKFTDACFTFLPGQSSSTACDALQVVVNTGFGSTILTRLFSDGAFIKPGNYSAIRGTAATLEVNSTTVAPVPEPATWASMFAGLAMAGGIASYRRRKAKVAFA